MNIQGGRKIILILIFLALGVGAGAAFNKLSLNAPTLPTKPPIQPIPPRPPEPSTKNPPETAPNPSPIPLPNVLNLKVPFTPQAPTANWDELHNEACEEASAIMAYKYFSGDASATLPAPLVETEISQLTDWQNQNFGYHLSIDTAETLRMLKEVYGLNAEIQTNFNADSIKKTLVEGNLIIWPGDGRMLGNPNFKRPGPKYHMLVIKGYDSQGNFLTNDPGTRKGLNYPYTFDVLYAANGNYDHQTETVDLNQKMVIIVGK